VVEGYRVLRGRLLVLTSDELSVYDHVDTPRFDTRKLDASRLHYWLRKVGNKIETVQGLDLRILGSRKTRCRPAADSLGNVCESDRSMADCTDYSVLGEEVFNQSADLAVRIKIDSSATTANDMKRIESVWVNVIKADRVGETRS
jgi:hypothetical protein